MTLSRQRSPSAGQSNGHGNGICNGAYSNQQVHINNGDRPNNILSRKNIRLLVVVIAFCGLYFVLERTERSNIVKQGGKANNDGNLKGKSSSLPSWPSYLNSSSATISARTPDLVGLYASNNGKKDNLPAQTFLLQPSQEFFPRICWLMSFPNSGTSYTMTMVARASNTSIASNYGDEVTPRDQIETLSIYPRRPEGPYWTGLTKSELVSHPRELPKDYVLTKTHCSSRCINCGPDDYIETASFFLKRCASGSARVAPNRRRIDVEYPPERVHKAIHLIRNPFHNIIARFHLDRRHYVRSNKTEWIEKHSNDAEGLQTWCKGLDEEYATQDQKYFSASAEVTADDGTKENIIIDAPCHGEFFKYTQWHNLVHESLDIIKQQHHDVPTLTVHYEDYTTNFNETAKEMLQFLNLELVGELRPFEPRSDYGSYFTEKQQDQVRRLIQHVASDRTWNQLKRYFD